MPLWHFPREVVEDAGTIHRPDCAEIPEDAILEVHPAGAAIRRDRAPTACWACEPELDMRLGV
jgi:hypothetical protein